MTMDALRSTFEQWMQDDGLRLTSEQWSKFETYHQVLVEWNEKMNLTAITDRDQVFLKHFYDSVTLSRYIQMNDYATLADIGSGAGFPSIPLKIMFPHLKVTIIDSLNKRIVFLKHLTEQLGLHDVNCLHGRAEDLARTMALRDSFHLVTARAVARLNVLHEFCLPFVRKNGLFAAMKGSQAHEEVEEAKKSAQELKARLEQIHDLQLPNEEGRRSIALYRKLEATPAKYPRKAGLPLKQPIGS